VRIESLRETDGYRVASGVVVSSLSAASAAAGEDTNGDKDDDGLDELASALEAAVVSPKANEGASIPRAPSNNPFDDFAPATAAAAAPAAAFEDAAVFAPTAPAAPAADFADLLK